MAASGLLLLDPQNHHKSNKSIALRFSQGGSTLWPAQVLTLNGRVVFFGSKKADTTGADLTRWGPSYSHGIVWYLGSEKESQMANFTFVTSLSYGCYLGWSSPEKIMGWLPPLKHVEACKHMLKPSANYWRLNVNAGYQRFVNSSFCEAFSNTWLCPERNHSQFRGLL